SLKEKEELKTEILFYLQDIKPLKARKYIKTSQNAYVRYHVYFPDKPGYIYELGYSYLHYRTFIHNIAKEIFYVFLISIIIAVFGTPIFLSGSLVKPLNAVLGGLKQVQEGNLNTSVPVYVQDEIGFLASSFNKMVTSIREGKAKLEEYSLSLEDKVEERTKELLVSYREIENLKEQQDGDYFLTTLLLSPLSINREISQRKILIDFFVKQKKEFQFRKRKHEIGGDICIAHDLKLKGKWYTAFLNADAMGKSMQGAGGVLVLGAVFQSILQRTATYKEQSEVYPEIWIKAAFKEMHKIFESFDGSMLISLIFGLVEEDTGLVYYINAEHPWLILYRDGKADFIEHELYFRKLGTSGMSNSLFVSTFQMMPGDMLIMGSDGKDDLLISNAENTRIINEDETYFLKHVEESNGDLNDIFKAITEKYELIDDFSLLSIQYPLLEEDLETKQKALEFIRKARNEIRNKMDDKALSTLE
ncbi:MAG: SpoIIE family protein phosphatase, partial [Leptospiraceae bacterium]|nr:SpoIIE family protein phosphatase [Leptospiraceae bacterium]